MHREFLVCKRNSTIIADLSRKAAVSYTQTEKDCRNSEKHLFRLDSIYNSLVSSRRNVRRIFNNRGKKKSGMDHLAILASGSSSVNRMKVSFSRIAED